VRAMSVFVRVNGEGRCERVWIAPASFTHIACSLTGLDSRSRSRLDVGVFVPAYCTAIGKALLASLSTPDGRETIARLKLKPRGPNTITKRGSETVDRLGRGQGPASRGL
jgi:hypothetical protein